MVSGECQIYAFWPSPQIQTFVGLLVVAIAFVIPLVMLIYCYGRILWVLTRRIDSNLDTRGSHADTFQVAKTNTLKTFLMVGICFIICWSSNQAYYLMDNIGYHVNWNGTYYKFTVLMVFLNCTVNPFIYLIKYKDYQLALKLCFGCGRRTDGEEIDMKSSTSTKSTIIGNHI